MRLYVVRHANKATENYFNEKLRHEDPPLSSEGNRLAAKLSEFLLDKPISKILVSEYLRAYQTAQYTAMVKHLPIIKDGRLNEIDNGVIEQLSDKEILQNYPQFWKDFFSFSKDVRFPGGETGEEVRTRQNSLLRELVLQNENALLVSHEGYIRLLICNILNLPVYSRHLFHMDFCGILELEYSPENDLWKILRINQTVSIE